MEEQGNPEMVALVLRDIINLALQGRYFFGEGSSDWDALLEKVSGERDVVLKYGEGVERLLGEYVLGKLPDFSGMSPLLTRLCEAVSDIEEKSRTGESCEDDWNRLWTTFSSLETLFGQTFLIPRARLVPKDSEATSASSEEGTGRWKGPGSGPDDAPRLGGTGVAV
ncbi:MAG: hypothetical protein HGB34_00755 [Candidatus Moranbacteria bacterium]|nr:hypothetical protein [Candidatus Moranbacteria bacterium]NTW75421.1 hypothetical protein [Candidatus Moranbacteria bacterium]